MKRWFGVFQLLPALLVALAAVVGFRSTAPLLEPVIWPEKPGITAQPEEVLLSTSEAEPAAPEAAEESALPSAGTGSYPDGVYTGTGTGYSGPTSVRVTVEGGQIVSVEITAHKDKDPFFSRAKGVIDRVLRAQSWQVDAVSGATYSSRGIEESRGPYRDGEWQGSAQGFGGDIAVRVTVSGGYVEDIVVLSSDGEDPAYFAEAETLLPELIAAQGGAVDTVSGATFSSTGLINAVANALEGAR